LKVERIDHIHIKVINQPNAKTMYEGVMGSEMLMEADFSEDYGLRIAYNPFPIGLELMEVTDRSKSMAKIYAESPDGVFALSLKVPDIEEATTEMELMGYKLLLRYDFGDIKEALFDSKKAMGIYFELIEYASENIVEADNGGVVESVNVYPKPS